jgi:hypothetical protein
LLFAHVAPTGEAAAAAAARTATDHTTLWVKARGACCGRSTVLISTAAQGKRCADHHAEKNKYFHLITDSLLSSELDAGSLLVFEWSLNLHMQWYSRDQH